MAVRVPHLGVPFRFNHGIGAYVTEQDSEEEIENCVEVIIRYDMGHRPEKPDFGIPDQTFASPAIDITLIQQAVDKWEPRVNLTIQPAMIDKVDQLITRIRMEATGE